MGELNAEIYASRFTGNNDVLAKKCSRSWVSLPGASGPQGECIRVFVDPGGLSVSSYLGWGVILIRGRR